MVQFPHRQMYRQSPVYLGNINSQEVLSLWNDKYVSLEFCSHKYCNQIIFSLFMNML